MTNDKTSSEPKDQRVPVMMSASELKEIDDWRRRQDELSSRSEAVRQLIALGLEASAAQERKSAK